MIVLNGEPVALRNPQALYPSAYELIAVEGTSPAALVIADESGHSTDKTLAVPRACQKDDALEGRVMMVTAEDEAHRSGVWFEKAEMSRSYADRATREHLWQVDADEFCLESAMGLPLEYLAVSCGREPRGHCLQGRWRATAPKWSVE